MAATLEAPPISNMLRVALIYADLGWPVFPCVPRDKRPMTGHGLKDATTDHEQIREWWGRTPDANLAIATGVAFDVLDVDELYRDDDGNVTGSPLDKWMPLADDPAVDPILIGPTVETGKGAHVYFSVTGHGNRAAFVPQCDWRGKGGYVIAPPSVHPSGAVYRFACGSSDDVFGVRAPLGPPPEWLAALIQPKPFVPSPRERTVDPSNLTVYGQRALENECGRIMLAPEGTRNDALNRGAFAMGQLVATGALTGAEAIDALEVAGSRAGLPDEEIRATIRSGFQKGYAQPRSLA